MICYIILFAASSNCTMELLIGLLMSLIPALLGWLMAQSYYKVPELRENNAKLTTANADLTAKVGTLTSENTDLRVKLTQLESELQSKKDLVAKQRNSVIIAESERNILKIKYEELMAAGGAALLAAAAGSDAEEDATKGGASGRTITFAGAKFNWDDLKIVEGIGPKIEELLHAGGIKTWKGLAETAETRLQEILDEAGPRYQMHNPATWPKQALMAFKEDWDGLKQYQDELTAGRA